MSDFVTDSTTLPFPKSDETPLPATADPTQWVVADDWNSVCQAAYDLRARLLASSSAITPTALPSDGSTDSTTSIQAALNLAGATVNGAFGAWVNLPKGTFVVASQLTIPNGVGLRGAGPSATILKAKNTFSATSLIRNLHQDGTQEFAFLEGLTIDGNQAGGAVCSAAVVDLVSLFINSYVRDVVILNGSNVGLHVGATNAMGPMYFENVWVANCTGHNVLCEEMAGNVGACAGLCFVNLTSEHQGTGKSALYLKGLGSAGQWSFFNTHIEQGGGPTSLTCITIDGVPDVLFDGVQLLTGSTLAMTAGIKITTAIQNTRIQIRSVLNDNLIDPVLSDAKNSVTIGAVAVPWYVTPEVNVRGGLRFTPDSTTGAKSLVLQDSAGTERLWFDDKGALNGTSFLGGAGLDVVGDATNDRPLMLVNHAKTQVYGWLFSGNDIRFRNLTGGVNLLNFDTSGLGFLYNPITFQSLLTLQAALKGPGTAAGAPSTGTHTQGEIYFNADAVDGGTAGWYCTVAGSPGTWVAFAGIGASGVPTSRTLTAGTGLSGGGDLSANRTFNIANTAVTPASYTNASLTVDQQGRLTAASSGTTPAVATRQIIAGTGMTGGGDLSADRTLTLANTAVTPAAYTYASLTVDQQGRLTAASSGTTPAVATRQIIAGTGMTGGGDLSADRTLTLANTAVTPASYTTANITVDAQGRLTAASTGSVPSVNLMAGDGSTGTVSLTGTITLTADVYWSTATVAVGGCTVNTANWKVYAQTLDTTLGTVVFQHNGDTASGNTGATGIANGGTIGVTSGTGTSGNFNNGAAPNAAAGFWPTSFRAGLGGAGGNGTAGKTGGVAGTAPTLSADSSGTLNDFWHGVNGRVGVSSSQPAGGAGGSSGGGSGAASAGGGGAGGGYCVVVVGKITGSAGNVTVKANGGVGGNGASACGGGGGGGGGYAVFALCSGSVTSVTVQASGGAGGTNGGSGAVDGSSGSAGKTMKFGDA